MRKILNFILWCLPILLVTAFVTLASQLEQYPANGGANLSAPKTPVYLCPATAAPCYHPKGAGYER